MFYKKEPRLYYIKQAIEENDDPDCEYKHDQIKEISVGFYCGNPMSPGDFWIANYMDENNRCVFDELYQTLEEFYKWNSCFSKDIFQIDFIKGIA